MLDLASDSWKKLEYFPDADIESLPAHLITLFSEPTQRKWSALNRALFHQDLLAPAIYAVLPHVMEDAAKREPAEQFEHLALVGHAARLGSLAVKGHAFPRGLKSANLRALKSAKALIPACLRTVTNEERIIVLLQGFAALEGQPEYAIAFVADAIEESRPSVPYCIPCERAMRAEVFGGVTNSNEAGSPPPRVNAPNMSFDLWNWTIARSVVALAKKSCHEPIVERLNKFDATSICTHCKTVFSLISGERKPESSSSTTCPIEDTNQQASPIGQRVRHSKFGEGFVKEAKEDKLFIVFDNDRSRWLLRSFVIQI